MEYQIPLSDPIEIYLTRGKIAFVNPIDSDLVIYKWRAELSRGAYYAVSTITIGGKRKPIRLHRLILERILDRKLESVEYCDHQDRNTMNCQRHNLRLATKDQNSRNRTIPTSNTSGYKGVSFHKPTGKWSSDIGYGGKKHHLGLFEISVDAAIAYDIAAIKHHGNFAVTNAMLGLLPAGKTIPGAAL